MSHSLVLGCGWSQRSPFVIIKCQTKRLRRSFVCHICHKHEMDRDSNIDVERWHFWLRCCGECFQQSPFMGLDPNCDFFRVAELSLHRRGYPELLRLEEDGKCCCCWLGGRRDDR